MTQTYKYSSNPWESNHRDGPTGHKKARDYTTSLDIKPYSADYSAPFTTCKYNV